MPDTYDVAIVGSGFAGSLTAMIARRLGRSVVLLERGKHPRFAIGESSTPLANLLFEELTTRYDLPRLTPFSKWGTWQNSYPDVACGLKRGFSFYHHPLPQPRCECPARSNQLLVAASPHDRIADTHWYRPSFDHFFANEAQNTGVVYQDQTRLDRVTLSDDDVKLEGHRQGRQFTAKAKFLIDATGPRGFLHSALGLSESLLPDYPQTQALFSHFSQVQRLENSLSNCDELPPYPVDDAAVHHVFDGGWIWVLRFNNGLTSAGAAVTDPLAAHLRLHEGEPAWQRLLDLLPAVKQQFIGAKAERPLTHMPRLSFRSGALFGKRWALLPSAAGFVDPLLSTGFPLTLLGVFRLARALKHLDNPACFQSHLSSYAAQTDQELLAASRLVAALYRSMDDFSAFVPLSLLYFAAASYSETVRRLGHPALASGFLLHDHPTFGPAFGMLGIPNSYADSEDLAAKVRQAIEPINIAGLGNPDCRNWYPVDANDLLQNASKVEATRDEVQVMLDRSGFWA